MSTEKQADLDAQRAKVKAYAELFDLDLAEVIVDAGESAKSLKRPGLQRALAMLERREAEALPGQCATGARTYKTGRHVGGTHGSERNL